MGINKLNLKYESNSLEFQKICTSHMNKPFSASELGEELSSVIGKITRFFVSVFTFTTVDLYEVRALSAINNFIISEPTLKSGSFIKEEETKPIQLEQQQKTIVKVEDSLKVQEIKGVENSGSKQLKQELLQAFNKMSKFGLLEVPKFQKNKAKSFDKAADIFVENFLTGKAPEKNDWNQAAETFCFFLDFALADKVEKHIEKNADYHVDCIDLKILAEALKTYKDTAELGKSISSNFLSNEEKNFINHYNQLLQNPIEKNTEYEMPTTVKGKLEYAFNKMSKFGLLEVPKFQKNNPKSFDKAADIFVENYLSGKAPVDWNQAAETFCFFLDFALADKVEAHVDFIDLEILAQALKTYKDTVGLGKSISSKILNQKEENFIAYYNLMSKPMMKTAENALPTEQLALKNDLNAIKDNPFSMITKLFGFFATHLPEGKLPLEEILKDLEIHKDTINASPLGETTSVSLKGIVSFLEMKWMGALFNVIKTQGTKGQEKAKNEEEKGTASPLDTVLKLLGEAKKDNENNVNNVLCNGLSPLVEILNKNPIIFKVLANPLLQSFIKSDNFIARGIKGFALRTALKMALKDTDIQLDEKTIKLAEAFLPIVAKLLKDVLPAMEKNNTLGYYLNTIKEKIFNPLAEGKVLDAKTTVDALLDLITHVVENIKNAPSENKQPSETKISKKIEIEATPVFATEKEGLRANFIFAFNDLSKIGQGEIKKLQKEDAEQFDNQVDIFIEHYLAGKAPNTSKEWEEAAKAFSFFVDFARSDNNTTAKFRIKDVDLKVLAAALKSYGKTDKLGTYLNEKFEANQEEKDFMEYYKTIEISVVERIKKVVERELCKLNISEEKKADVQFDLEKALIQVRKASSLALNDQESLLSVNDEVIKKAALKVLVGHLIPEENLTLTAKLKGAKEDPFSMIAHLFGLFSAYVPEAKKSLEGILENLEKHKKTINDSPFGKTTGVAVDSTVSFLEMKWLGTVFKMINTQKRNKSEQGEKVEDKTSPLEGILSVLDEAQRDNVKGNDNLLCNALGALAGILISNPIIFTILGSSFVQNFIASEGLVAMAIKKFGLKIALRFGLEKELGISLDEKTLKLVQEFLPIIAKFSHEVLPAIEKNEKLGPYMKMIKENIFKPLAQPNVDKRKMVDTFITIAMELVADMS